MVAMMLSHHYIKNCKFYIFLSYTPWNYQNLFSYQHNLLPANFNSCFEKVKTMHTHGTRMESQSKFFIPRYNAVTGQKSLMYSGAVMWNSLLRHITECDAVTSYCKTLKKYLLGSSEQ